MEPQYNDFSYNGPDHPKSGGVIHNAGFRMGIICGLVMGILHLVVTIILKSPFTTLFLVLWLVKLVVYYMAGRSAAQKQYESQRESVDSLNGVQGAGLGAGMITSLITWGFIFLGAFIQDAIGGFVFVEPVSLCVGIFADVAIAMGLGSLGGKQIADQYKVFDV